MYTKSKRKWLQYFLRASIYVVYLFLLGWDQEGEDDNEDSKGCLKPLEYIILNIIHI